MSRRARLIWVVGVLIVGAALGVGASALLRDGGAGAEVGSPVDREVAERSPAEPGDGGGSRKPLGASAADPGGSPGDVAADSDAIDERIRHATISVSGDILVHQPVWANALASGGGERYDFTPMFDAIRPYVSGADLAICHLETPVTSGEPAGYPLFSSPPELVESIARAGWDGCSTASNHALDMGMSGVEQTVAEFRRHGLGQSGSYATERQSRRPVTFDVAGAEIALLSYTDHTNGIPLPEPWAVGLLPAGDPAPGKAQRVAADVRRAVAAGADAALVAIQWGDEYSLAPNSSQVELARRIARIPDVLAIAGQGPHTVQPITRIGGKPVIYSSGNLLSNQSALAGLPAESQYGLIGLLRLVVVDRTTSTAGAADSSSIGSEIRHAGGEEVAGGEAAAAVDRFPGAVIGDDRVVAVSRVDYVPTWVRLSDHLVQPVGWGLEHDPANAAALRQAWQSTVSIAGRGNGIVPLPRNIP